MYPITSEEEAITSSLLGKSELSRFVKFQNDVKLLPPLQFFLCFPN